MRRWALLLAAGALVSGAAAFNTAAARAPLRTAVFEPTPSNGADGALELNRIRDAGASFVRISVSWASIAPSTRPSSFTASDPADPAYDWSALDAKVQAAVARRLQPILDVVNAPAWATARAPASSYPQIIDLRAFSTAIAHHYDGTDPSLPRIRYWQLWNEPNLNQNLTPQFSGTNPVSPGIYRSMANAFAAAVKGVAPTNYVIIGGLAPYGIQNKGQPINHVLSVAPQTFMRRLLCLSDGPHPHRTCNDVVHFDAFSVHPYTWGGPTHTAYSSNDVAIGDLPEVKQLLSDAFRLGRIKSAASPALWVTEFSWDTNPPDPKAIPIALQTRWTSEALYRMWNDGVAVITWFLIRDMPLSEPFQSGLYFRGATVSADKPKSTLTAFRFPFVALPGAGGTLVWGRTPTSTAAAVRIERQDGAAWRLVTVVQADAHGIFDRVLPLAARTGSLRARVGPAASIPFGLAPVPDRRISPFGG